MAAAILCYGKTLRERMAGGGGKQGKEAISVVFLFFLLSDRSPAGHAWRNPEAETLCKSKVSPLMVFKGRLFKAPPRQKQFAC